MFLGTYLLNTDKIYKSTSNLENEAKKERSTMNRVQGKVVLITGASSGMGAAMADLFAQQGTHLILLARREGKLQDLKTALTEKYAAKVEIFPLDVRDRQGISALGKTCQEQDMVPNILINNAGLAKGNKKVYEGDFADWDLVLDVNIKGMLNLCRIFLPYMLELNRGHIINIGSIGGHMVLPGSSVYNASKFALWALTQGTNLDLLGTNIRVSSIDPGITETDFFKTRYPDDPELAQRMVQGFKPLQAEDIAEAVLFAANCPDHVNVFDMILLPSAQRNIYFTHREETGENKERSD